MRYKVIIEVEKIKVNDKFYPKKKRLSKTYLASDPDDALNKLNMEAKAAGVDGKGMPYKLIRVKHEEN